MAIDIPLLQCEIPGTQQQPPRTIWIQRPTAPPTGLCLLLDGEYYLAQIRAAAVLAELEQTDQLPPRLIAYVSSIDGPTRWQDSFCNASFAHYLASHLKPWLIDSFGIEESVEPLLVGLSLTGLGAVHTALQFPGTFPRVLAQSGSFWWNDCWLPRNIQQCGDSRVRFRLSVGSQETAKDVDHGQGLRQTASQIEGVTRMHEALTAAGHRSTFSLYGGGHDIASWRNELAAGMIALNNMP